MQAPTAEVQAILEVHSELDEDSYVHRFHIHLPIITHWNLLYWTGTVEPRLMDIPQQQTPTV